MIWWVVGVAVYVLILSPAFAILAYIALSHVKKIKERGQLDQLPWWVLAVCYVAFGIGLPADVLLNHTYGSHRFGEARGVTMTSRLQYYRELEKTDERRIKAVKGWSWLNLFDPNHW